ncbi:MAG: hypothetical protein Q4G24_10750 [Paracoccus sp. (in: a-proteobacteria)]|uniref:hypothetical protein n=1 Tax=Paracoccus sp. TaxID=267 RepID=UPI0026DF2086|nr:hypothetical protein [Paracoccus sp. (in: a-proteobacteria)]MDO5621937.1 hypothetical protein [Paracoccus sp. (in: a-proteobacteria)]
MTAARKSDERILRMLAGRCAGLSSAQIADREGVSALQVRARTTEVRKADLAESGEDSFVVNLGYW